MAAHGQIALWSAVLEIGVRLMSEVLVPIVRAVAFETTRAGCVWAVMHLMLVGFAVGTLLSVLLRGVLQVACFVCHRKLLQSTRLGFRVHLGCRRIASGHQVSAGWDGVLRMVADASGFRRSGCVWGMAIVGWQGTGDTGARVSGGTACLRQFVGR